MQLNLEINNITQSPVKDAFLLSVMNGTFQELKYEFSDDKKISISLALVKPQEIRKLNKTYRQHDSVTDVLSFPEYKNIKEIKTVGDKELFLGELILCYDDIRQYAKKEKMDLEKELANVVSHGILHLLGFEHGKKMFLIQEKSIKSFR